MTTWFLAFLALIWIAVFLPGAVRARRRTPLPATTRFKRIMTTIAPPRPSPRHAAPRSARSRGMSSGRWIIVPRSDDRVYPRASDKRVRHRRLLILVLALLLVAPVVSAVAAVFRGQPWVEIHLMLDAALLFYVAVLHESKRRREERSMKVRRLRPPQREEVRMLRPRTAGGQR